MRLQGIMVAVLIKTNYPVQDDEYNYHDSLQAHLGNQGSSIEKKYPVQDDECNCHDSLQVVGSLHGSCIHENRVSSSR